MSEELIEAPKEAPKEKKPRKPRKRPACDPVVLKWVKLTGDRTEQGTVCATCVQALWQIEESLEPAKSPDEGPLIRLSVYCKLMHAFIDRKLTGCSGNP